MSDDEETFREFLKFRFDKIDEEIEEIKETLLSEARKRKTSDKDQVKRISHLEKRALVLATIVSIVYHFAVNNGWSYMKRKISDDSHSSRIKN